VTSASKVSDLREQMEERNAVLIVLTALDEVACKILISWMWTVKYQLFEF